MPTKRRDFLMTAAGATLAAAAGGPATGGDAAEPWFRTRGVVLRPKDTLIADWPERAARAGLTTIATHPFPAPVTDLLASEAGADFFSRCKKLGLQVEHELHAMRDLLPRGLFKQDPEMFRMEKGERTPAANCCPSSPRALEVIAASAVKVCRKLPSTTGRYFLWGDDMAGWCECPRCRELSPSDQALLVVNAMATALRKEFDPAAQIAHLAYRNTLPPPRQVKPVPGVFLEFAPLRTYGTSYESQRKAGDMDTIDALDANLEIFPRDTAQILEYWLDVGAFTSQAKAKEPIRLPWKRDVFLADLDSFRRRGIRHYTTFATGVNPDYQRLYGDLSFIDEYGAGLCRP